MKEKKMIMPSAYSDLSKEEMEYDGGFAFLIPLAIIVGKALVGAAISYAATTAIKAGLNYAAGQGWISRDAARTASICVDVAGFACGGIGGAVRAAIKVGGKQIGTVTANQMAGSYLTNRMLDTGSLSYSIAQGY